MYITPDTNIRLLHNVPIDNTYRDTIWFNNKTDQYNYFVGLTERTFTNQSYQRVYSGRLKVQATYASIFDVNYLMFQNTAYGDKWFYAFVTSIDYINDMTVAINYELDEIQTWLFDFHFNETFIARNHAMVDDIGSNLNPEPVQPGEYVTNGYKALQPASIDLNQMAVIVMVSDADNGGNKYNGVLSGSTYHVFNESDTAGISQLLSKYLKSPDSITGMYMVPQAFLYDGKIPSDGVAVTSDINQDYQIQAGAVAPKMAIDGYVPKNNKLFTYPYSYYMVDNGNGSSLVLRYEFFKNLTPTFELTGTITQPVTTTLKPKRYKGSGDEPYNAEQLNITGYPMCTWTYDAYKAWVAQNSVPMENQRKGVVANNVVNLLNTGVDNVNSTIGTGVAGLTKAAAGDIPGAVGLAAKSEASKVGNVIKTAAGNLNNHYQLTLQQETASYTASIQADPVCGNFAGGGTRVGDRKMNFFGARMSVTAQQARVIDDFFSMYGYAINRIGNPNRNGRPHWNYIQTVGCTIIGSVPNDDASAICKIHDNGITYWRNGNEVGNYTLDNSI